MFKLVSFFTQFLGGDFLTILSTKAQDWGLVHFQSICFTQKSGVIRYFSHELSETDRLNQPIPFPELWSSSQSLGQIGNTMKRSHLKIGCHLLIIPHGNLLVNQHGNGKSPFSTNGSCSITMFEECKHKQNGTLESSKHLYANVC